MVMQIESILPLNFELIKLQLISRSVLKAFSFGSFDAISLDIRLMLAINLSR